MEYVLLFFGLGDDDQSCLLFVALIGVLNPSRSMGAVSRFSLRRASVLTAEADWAEAMTKVEVVLRPEDPPVTDEGVMYTRR